MFPTEDTHGPRCLLHITRTIKPFVDPVENGDDNQQTCSSFPDKLSTTNEFTKIKAPQKENKLSSHQTTQPPAVPSSLQTAIQSSHS